MAPRHPSRSTADPKQQVAEIFATYYKFVWRCLAGLGLEDAELEDAVQEVFLVVHRRLSTFEGRSSLRTWIYGIVRHVGWRRRARRQRDLRRNTSFHESAVEVTADEHRIAPPMARAAADGSRLALDAHASEAEDIHECHQARAILRAFVETLDGPRREVFVLSEFAGMTAREIGETLGVNPNTVAGRLRFARRSLDQLVRRYRAQAQRGELRSAAELVHGAVGDSPSVEQRQAAWLLFVPQLNTALVSGGPAVVGAGGAAGVASVSGFGATKFTALVAAGAAMAAAGVAVTPSSVFEPERHEVVVAQPRLETHRRDDTTAKQAVAPMSTPIRQAVVAEPHPPRPTAGSVSAVAAHVPRVRSTPVMEEQASELSKLVGVLAEVRAALDKGEPRVAERKLAAVDRAHERGPLGPELLALRWSTSCRLGHKEAAARLRRVLIRAFPNSAISRQVGDGCE